MNQPVRLHGNPSVSFVKWVIIAVVTGFLGSLYCMKPIAQDPSYHHFADHRNIAGIANFWNVVTNLGFLFVGVWGLYKLLGTRSLRIILEIRVTYLLLFTGITLIALGSAYYHLHPTNLTLVWDRLPMTIVFMSLLVICIAECVSVNLARSALLPLLVAGLGSVIYWYMTELHGKGDLRPYILVQFVPVILLPLLLLIRIRRFSSQGGYWTLLSCYIIAKVAEHYDERIYQLSSQLIAGHALKHLFTVIGLAALVRFYEHRKPVPTS